MPPTMHTRSSAKKGLSPATTPKAKRPKGTDAKAATPTKAFSGNEATGYDLTSPTLTPVDGTGGKSQKELLDEFRQQQARRDAPPKRSVEEPEPPNSATPINPGGTGEASSSGGVAKKENPAAEVTAEGPGATKAKIAAADAVVASAKTATNLAEAAAAAAKAKLAKEGQGATDDTNANALKLEHEAQGCRNALAAAEIERNMLDPWPTKFVRTINLFGQAGFLGIWNFHATLVQSDVRTTNCGVSNLGITLALASALGHVSPAPFKYVISGLALVSGLIGFANPTRQDLGFWRRIIFVALFAYVAYLWWGVLREHLCASPYLAWVHTLLGLECIGNGMSMKNVSLLGILQAFETKFIHLYPNYKNWFYENAIEAICAAIGHMQTLADATLGELCRQIPTSLDGVDKGSVAAQIRTTLQKTCVEAGCIILRLWKASTFLTILRELKIYAAAITIASIGPLYIGTEGEGIAAVITMKIFFESLPNATSVMTAARVGMRTLIGPSLEAATAPLRILKAILVGLTDNDYNAILAGTYTNPEGGVAHELAKAFSAQLALATGTVVATPGWLSTDWSFQQTRFGRQVRMDKTRRKTQTFGRIVIDAAAGRLPVTTIHDGQHKRIGYEKERENESGRSVSDIKSGAMAAAELYASREDAESITDYLLVSVGARASPSAVLVSCTEFLAATVTRMHVIKAGNATCIATRVLVALLFLVRFCSAMREFGESLLFPNHGPGPSVTEADVRSAIADSSRRYALEAACNVLFDAHVIEALAIGGICRSSATTPMYATRAVLDASAFGARGLEPLFRGFTRGDVLTLGLGVLYRPLDLRLRYADGARMAVVARLIRLVANYAHVLGDADTIEYFTGALRKHIGSIGDDDLYRKGDVDEESAPESILATLFPSLGRPDLAKIATGAFDVAPVNREAERLCARRVSEYLREAEQTKRG
jgi:hypothetical protein